MIDRLLRRLTEPVDGTLFTIALAILALGLATLFSASNENGARFSAQLGNIGVALTLMWLMAQVPPQTLMRFAPPIYALGLVLLVAVALVGDVRNGARRWLNLTVTSVQPSEMMKIAMPLMLAWYFQKREAVVGLADYLVAGFLLLVPTALIAKQPDLGTALLVAAAGFYVIYLAGISWKVLAGAVVAGLASLPVVWSALHD